MSLVRSIGKFIFVFMILSFAAFVVVAQPPDKTKPTVDPNDKPRNGSRDSKQPSLPCAGFWLGKGYEQVTMHIPRMREQGEYYTFLAKKARGFQCPGRVH